MEEAATKAPPRLPEIPPQQPRQFRLNRRRCSLIRLDPASAWNPKVCLFPLSLQPLTFDMRSASSKEFQTEFISQFQPFYFQLVKAATLGDR